MAGVLSRALWRRHWMEIRGGLLVAAAVTGLLTLFYPLLVALGFEDMEVYRRFSAHLSGFEHRLADLGADRFFPWAAHASLCAIASFAVPIFVGGSGIRTNSLTPAHSSLYYTLTLPVARPVLIATRFAAAVAAAIMLLAAMLAINVAVLGVAGWQMPMAELVRSTAAAAFVAIVVIAVLGVLLPIWNEGVVALAITAALVAAVNGAWPYLTGLIASPVPPWIPLAWGAGLIAASLTLAAITAARKDF